MAADEKTGIVTNYHARIGVVVIRLTDTRTCGLTAWSGSAARRLDFTQPVASLEIEHQPVTRAARGSEVALKVRTRVRRHDQVLRVPELEPPRDEVDGP